MYVYGFLFAFPAILALVEVFVKLKKEKIIFFFLTWSILLIFTGLRLDVGNDYVEYKNYFLSGNHFVFELGYSAVSRLAYILSEGSFQFYFLLIALLSYIVKFKVLIKTPYPTFALFYFFSVYGLGLDMNLMRQGIAVSIVLLAINYLVYGSIKSFFISVCVASFMHITAIIALPLVLIRNVKFNYFISMAILFIAALVSFSNLANYILINALSISDLNEKILFYIENSDAFGYESGLKIGWLKKIFIISLFYFTLSKNKYINSEKINLDILFWSMTIGFAISFIFDGYGDFAKRLPLYFEVSEVILATYSIYFLKSFEKKIILILLLTTIVGLKYYSFILDPVANIYFLPYKFNFGLW